MRVNILYRIYAKMSNRNSDRWPALRSLPGPSAFRPVADLDGDPYPEAGIYYLTDEAGEIVYVGQSGDIRARIATHRREGKKTFKEAYFWRCLSPSDRLAYEGILILASRARYNRSVNIGLSAEGRAYDLTRSTFARLGACGKRKSAKKKDSKPRAKVRVAKRSKG